MRLFAMAGLTVATIIATMLVSFFTPANAVVCAHGVYRAGCVGPHGLLCTLATTIGTIIRQSNVDVS